jgi:hypothetical protein
VVSNFDRQVYDNVADNLEEGRYGNYFVYSLNDTYIETIVFNNATSMLAIPAFGNYMLENILRKFTGKNTLKLEFINNPLPLSL